MSHALPLCKFKPKTTVEADTRITIGNLTVQPGTSGIVKCASEAGVIVAFNGVEREVTTYPSQLRLASS